MNEKMITMSLNEYESDMEELENYRSGKIHVSRDASRLTFWSNLLDCYSFYSENELFEKVEKTNKDLLDQIKNIETSREILLDRIKQYEKANFWHKLYNFFKRS